MGLIIKETVGRINCKYVINTTLLEKLINWSIKRCAKIKNAEEASCQSVTTPYKRLIPVVFYLFCC